MATTHQESNADLGSFPTPFDRAVVKPAKTLVELEWQRLSEQIRADNPNWCSSLDSIEQRHTTAMEAAQSQSSNQQRRQKRKSQSERSALAKRNAMFQLAMQQLRFFQLNLSWGDIRVSPVDVAFESDARIDEQLRLQLAAAVSHLPPGRPRPDQRQIVDLVQPNLYCLVSGVSRRVDDARQWSSSVPMGDGQVIRFGGGGKKKATVYGRVRKNVTMDDELTDAKFQWLPTDIVVDIDGHVKFDGYINNLNPMENAPLYALLERILQRLMPMYEFVLRRRHDQSPRQIRPSFSQAGGGELLHDEATIPQVYKQPDAYKGGGAIDLRNRRLQVIVKLANIELTPDEPEYAGGSWHVEGMRNESIVATALYYYELENVSESRLQFRVAIDRPVDNWRASEEVYGLRLGEALNQEIGAVRTRQGRCVCFANTAQHRVAPFRLVDATRPGHRKMLAVFLVDPTKEILSTARVPPQQIDWYMPEALTSSRMPRVVIDKITGYIDCPFSVDKAMEYQKELIGERKYFGEKDSKECYERTFTAPPPPPPKPRSKPKPTPPPPVVRYRPGTVD